MARLQTKLACAAADAYLGASGYVQIQPAQGRHALPSIAQRDAQELHTPRRRPVPRGDPGRDKGGIGLPFSVPVAALWHQQWLQQDGVLHHEAANAIRPRLLPKEGLTQE